MSTKKEDPRDALRNTQVHIKQVTEAIAETERQRSEAVAGGDLESLRKYNRRIADLKSDLGSLEEGRGLFAAQVERPRQRTTHCRLRSGERGIEAVSRQGLRCARAD
jgi:hypothetical protein